MRTVQLAILAAAVAASTSGAAAETKHDTARISPMADNPFAQPSTLAFQLPPFDRIRDADYLPAFEAGMRAQLAEVAAIAHNPQPPTFENTIVALERSGQLLTRVDNAFARLNACNTNPQMQKIDTEMAPRLTAQEDAIHLDPALWARVDALYQKRATLNLDPESLQLLTRYHTVFVRAGARLSPAEQCAPQGAQCRDLQPHDALQAERAEGDRTRARSWWTTCASSTGSRAGRSARRPRRRRRADSAASG